MILKIQKQELKDKAIREQQIEGLTTELAAKSKAM